MNNFNIKSIVRNLLCLLTFVLIFSFNSSVALAAIGISPPSVTVNNILNSNQVEKYINVVRSDKDIRQCISIESSGSGQPYVTFSSTMEFAVGEQKKPFSFIIAPTTAGTGTYETLFSFREIDCVVTTEDGLPGDSSMGVSMRMVLSGKVNFTVTNQAKKELVVKNIKFENSEENQTALLLYHLSNTGNVDTSVDAINIAIYSKDNQELIKEIVISSQQLPITRALAEEQHNVPITIGLPAGNYLANIDVWLDEQNIYSDMGESVNILPPGSLDMSLNVMDFKANSDIFAIDSFAKFILSARNTGQASILATLVVEIEEQGQIKDILNSKEVFIQPGRTVEMEIVQKLDKIGDFLAKGHLEYGPYISDISQFAYKVRSENEVQNLAEEEKQMEIVTIETVPVRPFLWGALVVVTIAIAVILIKLNKK